MNGNCIEIGTIQAFLDGELNTNATAMVTNHLAACDACTQSLAEAEEQSAFVFAALEREFDTMVPTQRLWSKINETIAIERKSTPFWRRVWVFFAVQLKNPSIAATASILVIFSVLTLIWTKRSEAPMSYSPSIATTVQSPVSKSDVAAFAPPKSAGSPVIENVRSSDAEAMPKFVAATSRAQAVPVVERAIYRQSRPERVVNAPMVGGPPSEYVQGEESYVDTIARMSQTVDVKKGNVMKPSQQITYERDMAVVNDAIKKMRNEVRRNPKSESALQVLYTSYQNKIDLMNSVSQREELIASLN
ncbi:MAG: zf-HC2 domain-containing protein [Pyrinomonadaceae bacterium]